MDRAEQSGMGVSRYLAQLIDRDELDASGRPAWALADKQRLPAWTVASAVPPRPTARPGPVNDGPRTGENPTMPSSPGLPSCRWSLAAARRTASCGCRAGVVRWRAAALPNLPAAVRLYAAAG